MTRSRGWVSWAIAGGASILVVACTRHVTPASDAAHAEAPREASAEDTVLDAVADGARDAASGPDASAEAGADVAPITSSPNTRPLAPLSTSTVSTRQPSLGWLVGSADRAPTAVRLCRDRALSTGCQMLPVAGGTGVRPQSALAAGIWYWQLVGAAETQPVWQFRVNRREGGRDASGGTELDVNGDGFADVVAGNWQAMDRIGGAYLFLGSATGPSATPSLTLVGPDGAESSFGASMASAGDVNGDGFADLVVGAYSAMHGKGRVHVYLGSATGPSATPSLSLTGISPHASFGYSVASGGDVNGDGFADLVVGALGNPGGTPDGVYVYLGSATALPAAPSLRLTGPQGVGLLNGLVVGAGDCDGDGFADLVVGGAGDTYVYLGGATVSHTMPSLVLETQMATSVASAGDVDGDGFADLLVGDFYAMGQTGQAYLFSGSATGFGAMPSLTLTGPTGFRRFGASMASAGDVNGDGFADLVVSSSRTSLPAGVHVYLGSAAGLNATPSLTLAAPDPAAVYDATVAGAGDVNGDGFTDVVVDSLGQSYVYLGSATGLGTTPSFSLAVP